MCDLLPVWISLAYLNIPQLLWCLCSGISSEAIMFLMLDTIKSTIVPSGPKILNDWDHSVQQYCFTEYVNLKFASSTCEFKFCPTIFIQGGGAADETSAVSQVALQKAARQLYI